MPTAERPARSDAVWYAAFGAVAIAVALVDGAPLVRTWGRIAAVAYLAGAGWSAVDRGGLRQRVIVAAAVFSAAAILPLALELVWRADHGLGSHAKSETIVTEEAAVALVDGSNPYAADYSAGPLRRFPAGVDRHVPYLPGNLVLGLARPLAGDGVLGDARIASMLVFLAALLAALGLSRAPGDARLRAFQLIAVSPLGARYVVGGGNDLPVIGAMLLALVLLDRRRPGAAGAAAGIAAAVKLTAWPLLPFLVVAARDRGGGRAGLGTATVAGAIVLAALVPFLVWDARALVEDVVHYPLGLTAGGTPAASPTIGGALAAWFPGADGAIALLAAAATAATAGWLLLRRPPATARDAASSTAVVILVAVALATAGRFGYLLYAVDLWLWAAWILPREPAPVATPSPVTR